MPKCSILSFYLFYFYLFTFLSFCVLSLTYAKTFHFIFTQMFLPSKLVFTVSFSLFPIFYVDFPQKFRLKQFISYCSPIMSLFEGLLLGKVARDCPYLSPLSVQQCNWKHRLVRPPFSSVYSQIVATIPFSAFSCQEFLVSPFFDEECPERFASLSLALGK